MKRHLRLLILALALLGCTAETRHAAPQGNSQSSIESQQLRQMLEDYFEEFLRLAPCLRLPSATIAITISSRSSSAKSSGGDDATFTGTIRIG